MRIQVAFYFKNLPGFDRVIIAHMKLLSSAVVKGNLKTITAAVSYQMVVRHGSSKELPGTVMVADVSEAPRLGDTTIDEEVSVCDGGSDSETPNGVTPVSVDALNVDAVARAEAVGV